MDVARAQQGTEFAVMALLHSKSNNIIGFFWNDYEIVPRWIMRDEDGNVRGCEEMNMVHRMAMGMTVKDVNGRIRVEFGLLDRPMYLVNTGGTYAVVFLDANGKPAKLREIFVDLSEPSKSSCVCLCELLEGPKFTETLTLNLSFMESFM
jgi:hypothetical protein